MSTIIYTKAAVEDEPYHFDFSAKKIFDDGDETITSATVTSTPSGLTVGSPVIGTGDDSAKVQVRISSGTAGTLYSLTCTIATSGSNTLNGYGLLSVV